MSEKSVAQKLIIKPGTQVRVVKSPIDIIHLLGTLPEGASLVDLSDGAETILLADLILLFVDNRVDLEALLPGLRTALTKQGTVWVAYHKGTSQIKTDINRDSINAYASTLGFQGVAMISINEDWSALRLKPV